MTTIEYLSLFAQPLTFIASAELDCNRRSTPIVGNRRKHIILYEDASSEFHSFILLSTNDDS